MGQEDRYADDRFLVEVNFTLSVHADSPKEARELIEGLKPELRIARRSNSVSQVGPVHIARVYPVIVDIDTRGD